LPAKQPNLTRMAQSPYLENIERNIGCVKLKIEAEWPGSITAD
jgi:hypothetical protein